MISRRYLRTKVMQAIFAHEMNPQEDVVAGAQQLNTTIDNCYNLFLYFFSILPEIKSYCVKKMEERKKKNFPTEEDLNPNTKFVDNVVIEQIENNRTLNILWKERKIFWKDHNELIAALYRQIAQTQEFEDYMNKPERSYKDDKAFLLYVVENVFAPNELLHWFFEEQNVNWFDDFNEAMLMFYKNLESFKETADNLNRIMPLYGKSDDDDDRKFAHDLFMKTAIHDTEYTRMIEERLQNWELERVAQMDIILLKMAICELMEFPNIPIKVTINEYIELARWYSSEKSGGFINGMLDRIIEDLKSEGKLNKSGKGLLTN